MRSNMIGHVAKHPDSRPIAQAIARNQPFPTDMLHFTGRLHLCKGWRNWVVGQFEILGVRSASFTHFSHGPNDLA